MMAQVAAAISELCSTPRVMLVQSHDHLPGQTCLHEDSMQLACDGGDLLTAKSEA